MSQFEKAVKLSDEQFLRAVGIDKTAFNLILERVATHLENLREERPMKKRGKKSEVALADRLLLTFTYMRHYPTFARLGMEFGISESYANKLYHQILDVLVILHAAEDCLFCRSDLRIATYLNLGSPRGADGV